MTIIMKDQADKTWLTKPETHEDKLGHAIAYMLERSIWRGKAGCTHVYTNSDGKRIPPSMAVYRSDSKFMV